MLLVGLCPLVLPLLSTWAGQWMFGWAVLLFYFVQSKQFGICLIPVLKIIYFFPNCFSTGKELSWAWAPGYSGTMTGTAADTWSIVWKWPMDCPCCRAGCGEFKCTGELAREKMQCCVLPSVPSLYVLVRASSSQSLKKQLWFIACF